MAAKKHDYFTIRYLIRHPDAKLQSIADGMGCAPDHSWEYGTPKVTPSGRALGTKNADTMWTKIYRFPGRKDFFKCAEEVLDKLYGSKDFILDLENSGGTIFILIDISGCNNVGDVLSSEATKRINDLGITLGLELFPL